MTNSNVLALRSLTAIAVKLPMKRPLGTSAKSINEACLLLVDLQAQNGIVGRAYAFCHQPSIARSLVPIVAEPARPGKGLAWNDEVVARYRLA